MSARMVEDAYKHSRATGAAKRLLLAMCHVVDQTGLCWLGNHELMARADIESLRGLYRAREQLVELDEIKVEQKGGGRGITTSYRMVDLGARNRVAGGTVSVLKHARHVTVSRSKTVTPVAQNSDSLNARAGRSREEHELKTPLGPPKGGRQTTVSRWGELLEDLRPTLHEAGGSLLQLETLDPSIDGDTIVLHGSSAKYCADRYGPLVAASAARLGVTVAFAPAPPPESRRRRRRRAA